MYSCLSTLLFSAMSRRILTAAVVLTVGLSLATPLRATSFEVETDRTTFTSAGKKIRIECFTPKGQDNCPAIVLVHDAAGMGLMPAMIFRTCSQMLAKEGYVVLLVYYFDGTGLKELTPAEARAATAHWDTWKNTIADAVKFTARHPRVDPERIGLLGFSLGAYLSLAVGTQEDLKVRAVAEFFGALPERFWTASQKLHLPPTLIIHGTRDEVVPTKEAYALRGLLATRKIPFEIKLYNCGHLFAGTQMRWQPSFGGALWNMDGDIADARERVLRFFGQHLRRTAELPDSKQ